MRGNAETGESEAKWGARVNATLNSIFQQPSVAVR